MSKDYWLMARILRPLAIGLGSCLVSDRIIEDGLPVGYMCRDSPEGSSDSGWRFYGGDESQAYADDPSHVRLRDVNAVANFDPTIVPLLSDPVGSAYGRGDHGQWLKTVHRTTPTPNNRWRGP